MGGLFSLCFRWHPQQQQSCCLVVVALWWCVYTNAGLAIENACHGVSHKPHDQLSGKQRGSPL
jgi:hypothetical protein